MQSVTAKLSNYATAPMRLHQNRPSAQSAHFGAATHSADTLSLAATRRTAQLKFGATPSGTEEATAAAEPNHSGEEPLAAHQRRVAEQVRQLSMPEVHQHMAASRRRMDAYLVERDGRHAQHISTDDLRPLLAQEVILQQQLQQRIQQEKIQKVMHFLAMGIALGLALLAAFFPAIRPNRNQQAPE